MRFYNHQFILQIIFILDSNENDRKASLIQTRDYRFISDMHSRYPLHHYHRAAKIMKRLRAIKTPLEVEVLQQAIDITQKTFERLLEIYQTGSNGI